MLDEHLPLAIDSARDMVMRPAFAPTDIEREQSVILEEIKMVEDTPDDLVHEVFTQQFWDGHPLGRPILGTPETVESFTPAGLREYFRGTYVAPNLIIAAAGNLDHAQLRDARSSGVRDDAAAAAGRTATTPPDVTPRAGRSGSKDIEQSHVCLGTRGVSAGARRSARDATC